MWALLSGKTRYADSNTQMIEADWWLHHFLFSSYVWDGWFDE